jgi:multidrug efflux pump subunit AcrB
MTTLAMVAGMLPIVLQLEEGDTTYQEPLAATVIGGLLVGTALSLLAVPVVFVYVAKLERAVHRLLKR